jgi:hypothetical protein
LSHFFLGSNLLFLKGILKKENMPRPKSKSELLALSAENYSKLLSFIENLPPAKQQSTFPKGYLNRSIRDVLAHLHAWHLLFNDWYSVGMKGEKPAIPAEGYTWKTTPDLNVVIQKKYADTPIAEVRKNLEQSHEEIMHLIKSHSDEELFEKKRYKWTGTTSLGAYLISATSSHYDWALKLIKKAIK